MKRGEIWDLQILVTLIPGTFYLLVFKVIFWVIRCNFLKIACILKKSGLRVKRTEIWELGDTSNKHVGYI